MLKQDPLERLTIQQVQDHPWLQEEDPSQETIKAHFRIGEAKDRSRNHLALNTHSSRCLQQTPEALLCEEMDFW